jgi:hypothetical protein
LSDEQRARMDAHADRWIALGLSTGAAQRHRFEAAMRRCYEHAGIAWHDNVVWASSPPALALCAALADLATPSVRKEAIAAALGDALRGEVPGDVLARLMASALRAVDADPVRYDLELMAYPVGEAITRAVDVTVTDAVERAVRSAVRSATADAVDTLVAVTVAAAMDGVVAADSPPTWHQLVLGPLWCNGWYWGPAFASFFREACGLELTADLADRAMACEQAAAGAWWCYPHREFVLACERPRQIHLEQTSFVDVRGRRGRRLHHLWGPAISWPDGWSVHAIHGVPVPARIIEQPQSVTVRDIETQRNAEVRRVLLERYGWARYMADSGADVVDEVPKDHMIVGLRGARLLSKVLPGEPEPMVYLEMMNSSPEPDGTYRRYLERIDPKAYGGDAGRLCHAAMASRWRHRDGSGQLRLTFANWREYRPLVES